MEIKDNLLSNINELFLELVKDTTEEFVSENLPIDEGLYKHCAFNDYQFKHIDSFIEKLTNDVLLNVVINVISEDNVNIKIVKDKKSIDTKKFIFAKTYKKLKINVFYDNKPIETMYIPNTQELTYQFSLESKHHD
jgi:hypothetical protein